MPTAQGFLQSKSTLWVVGAIIFACLLVTNLPWHLNNYDQAKQAFTSLEMVKEGHWLYQRTPHERIATKPPLVGWVSAAFYGITRSWDFGWRVPSLIAAVAIAVLLWRAGNFAYGPIAGLVGLSAFGLNLLSPRLATLVRTDMPLALAIFLIGLQIWKKTREQASWTSRDRLRTFALLTIGMLIKGPIVYAFLLPGIVIFQWWRRGKNVASAWCGWWPWLASLAIFLIWVAGGILYVPEFLDQVVVREFIGRFGETIHRPQPIYFYLLHILYRFAPWSLLLIFLAILGFRSESRDSRAIFRQMSPELFWLLCWVAGGIIVMSLIPSKRVDRIFPVIPPMCLLLAAAIGRLMANDRLRQRGYRLTAAATVLAILFTGGYSAAKIGSAYRDRDDALAKFGKEVRKQADAHKWRYEVLMSSDEGLLLYLEKLHFIRFEPAVADWNRGNLDALVASTKDEARLMRELPNATLYPLKPEGRLDTSGPGYILITR